MRSIVKLLKTNLFEISSILCFLLPPIGIFLLFILSFVSIFRAWKEKKRFDFSLISFFFLCLLLATIGAVIQMKNVLLLVDSFMIIGYWGIYLRIASNSSINTFQNYKWIMIFGGIYNCLIGWVAQWWSINPVLGLLTGTKLLADMTPKNYHRLIGSAYNPNFTMYLLLVAIAFLFAEMLTNIRQKQWPALIWKVALLLILSNGVLATGSRAGFFVMICIYFIFFIRLNLVIFLFSSVLIFFIANPLLQLMPRNDTIDYSYLVREKIWMNSFELWKQHFLFGTTPHGFSNMYIQLFDKSVPHAHNIFIGFFAEFGIVGGIALFILLFVTIYKLGYLFFSKDKNTEGFENFLLSLPIIVLTGILDEPTFSPQIALLTVMLLSYWEQYSKNYVRSYQLFSKIKYYLNFKKNDGS